MYKQLFIHFFATIILIVAVHQSFAQFNASDFPGYDVELLSDKLLRVEENTTIKAAGYNGFYKTERLSDGIGKYEILVGKIFKLLSYDAYNPYGSIRYKLKLQNSELGIIYFDYDPSHDAAFPFEVIGGIDLNNFVCKHIDTITERFSYDTTFYAPQIDHCIQFFKAKDKSGVSRYFLKIVVSGSGLNLSEKGITLLLERDFEIKKPDPEFKMMINKYGAGYDYYTNILLTNDDLRMLLHYGVKTLQLLGTKRTIIETRKGKSIIKCLTANEVL